MKGCICHFVKWRCTLSYPRGRYSRKGCSNEHVSPSSSALQVSMILTQCRFNAEPPSPVLPNIHSILASELCCRVSLGCTSYTPGRPTRPIPVQCLARVAVHCWFIAGQSSTMLAQHYSNSSLVHRASSGPTNVGALWWWSEKLSTTLTSKTKQIRCHSSVYSTHWTGNQCWSKVSDYGQTTTQHWLTSPSWLCCILCGSTVALLWEWNFPSPSPERQNIQIKQYIGPNVDEMLVHHQRRWA